MNNNPLKQYFRRPAVFIKLPSNGKGYSPEALDMPENGELPVYPMTAIDEITSRTPDALYNGASVVEIIHSCIPNIKNPWEVSAIDLDTILLAIRAASGSGTVEIDTSCPKCKNEATYSLEIPRLLASLKAADYDTELQINDLSIKFRPIKFKQINEAGLAQFEVSKSYTNIANAATDEERLSISQKALQAVTELTMDIVAKGIEYIKTPNFTVTEEEHIIDYLKNCDRNSYITIRDYSTTLKSKSELQPIRFTCDSVECRYEFEQSIQLNPADFFG
jgi:hypothetical protein